MVVFFTLGLGGEMRSMTHWGVGGDSDGDPCAIVYVVADIVEQRDKKQGLSGEGDPCQP